MRPQALGLSKPSYAHAVSPSTQRFMCLFDSHLLMNELSENPSSYLTCHIFGIACKIDIKIWEKKGHARVGRKISAARDENEKDISEISQWKTQYSPYEAVPRT